MGVNTTEETNLVEVRNGEYDVQGLIPGFEQVVQVKIKEGSTYRLLDERTFKTSGKSFYLFLFELHLQ